jgi:hypothetical protein
VISYLENTLHKNRAGRMAQGEGSSSSPSTKKKKRIKLDPYLTTYIKIKPKWIKYLHVRTKTIKLLEANTGRNLHDIRHTSNFLAMTPTKNRGNKRKIIKLDFKIKNSCQAWWYISIIPALGIINSRPA